MSETIEYFFECPYCMQKISVLIDPSESSQSYIEDCEVCCRPVKIKVEFNNIEIINFEAEVTQ